MITVVCWKWGNLFGPEYVNTLRSMLARHLHVEHELVCVTDAREGIDEQIRIVDLPSELSSTPRCLRRLRQYDAEWASKNLGLRILSIDLDVVIVRDVTPLFDRPNPVSLWYVPHSQIYCTSIVLYTPEALKGIWEKFIADPAGYAIAAMRAIYPSRRMHIKMDGSPFRVWHDVSDQPIVNHYVREEKTLLKKWTPDADGIIPYFGEGYRIKSPPLDVLPAHARIIALGSSDKAVMDGRLYPWVEEHWK